MTTTTEEKPEAQPTPPERVSLKYLLEEDARVSKGRFEEWALQHWANAAPHYERARLQLRALERLGIASEALEAERARLALWHAQILEAMPLSASSPEEPALDYCEPVTLKYFGLWLWLNDHAPTVEDARSSYGEAMSADDGPLDWAKYFEPELLDLPAFNCK